MITPPTPTSGIIRLIHVPFDSNYKNVIDFKNNVDKEQFFFNRIVKLRGTDREITLTFENCSYSRKNGKMQVPVHIDALNKVNYLMYNNPYYTNKWYYCFVIGKKYVNDHCTELFIKTDVFQTWFEYIHFEPSFVEREHTLNDYPGSNLLPEGLETGEFIPDAIYELNEEYFAPIPCIAYTGDILMNRSINQHGTIINGILNCIPFIIGKDMETGRKIIEAINIEGQGDKIFACFTIPRLAVLSTAQMTDDVPVLQLGTRTEPPVTIAEINKPTTLHGYSPRNKKLLTYPFTYLGFNPPNGSSKIYRFENYIGSPINFEAISEVNPNPTVVIYPKAYVGANYFNIAEAVTINGYPTLSYRNDYYNTWLAQNSGTVKVNVDRTKFNYEVAMKYNENAQNREMTNAMFNGITSTVGVVSNALSLNLGGALNTAIGGIQSAYNSDFNLKDLQLGEYSTQGNLQYDLRAIQANSERQQMLPDTGGLSASNATLLGYNLLHSQCFMVYSIKSDQAQRIDEYFDMFGYQTNRVKIPNCRGRKSWNYVKTVGVNISGNIPEDDRLELCSIFDSGVTIWHFPAKIYRYGVNNEIEV